MNLDEAIGIVAAGILEDDIPALEIFAVHQQFESIGFSGVSGNGEQQKATNAIRHNGFECAESGVREGADQAVSRGLFDPVRVSCY